MKTALATLLLLLAGAVSAPAAAAQTSPYPAPWYFAASYGSWSIASQQANTYTFFPISVCNVPSPSAGVFFPFNTNAPVLIQDVNNANSEVVTPTGLVQTSSQCGITATPTNQHYSFWLRSGTGGLQEALNALIAPSAYPALIVLDRNWYTQAQAITSVSGTSPASMISSAHGGAGAILEDITTVNPTYYIWNGTSYAASGANLSWSNTAPTLAAGSAAGTSPTVANKAGSTQLAGQANVTSGTATTTGTLFTETFPEASAGGLTYAGTCTVTSVGANSFTAFTVATSTTGSAGTLARVLTVTATSAPTASTAYQFAYSCK